MEHPRGKFHIICAKACNNNCAFCIDGDKARNKDLIPTEQDLRRELERNRKYTDSVVFTSGEPTLNPHLLHYAYLCREYGYRNLELATNGKRLSDPAYVESLLRAGINIIIVGIHGHCAAVHDRQTRTPGSFDKSILALMNLSLARRTHNFELNISSTLNRMNLEHLKAIVTLASRFDINGIVFNIVVPIENALKNFHEVVPRFEDVRPVVLDLIGFVEKHKPEFAGKVRFSGLPICVIEPWFSYAGFQDELILHDVYEENRNFGAVNRLRFNFKLPPVCRECIWARICPGAHVNYLSRYGDLFAAPGAGLAGNRP